MVSSEYKSTFEFAKNTNWKNPDYIYLKNVKITEWDIESAGLSVIKFKKFLPAAEISKLESMDKHSRTVREGIYQKNNKALAKTIIDTLEDVRYKFVSYNNIYKEDVLSIKKDAIFVINKTPEKTIVDDYFKFREKGKYTSFALLNKIEFYLTDLGEIEVKGIGEKEFDLQKNYFLKDLKYLMTSNEKFKKEQMFLILKNYRSKYLNRKLPIDTYRELNTGMFRVGKYLLNEIDESLVDEIDISQNYINYIFPLFSMFL